MDQTSINALIDRYSVSVYNLALRVTGSKDEAEEIVQETFLQVYQNLDGFRGESQISTWIYKIALNISLKAKKKADNNLRKTVQISENAQEMAAQISNWDTQPEKAYLMKEIVSEMRQTCLNFLTNHLPEEQRVVHILRYLQDFSYREIAEILGISETLVKVRLNRSREKLREFLETRCQWLNPNNSCSCKNKISQALLYDHELVLKVALLTQPDSKRPGYKDISSNQFLDIDELLKSQSLVEYRPKGLKGRLAQGKIVNNN